MKFDGRISRRTVLRGLGTVMALPLLESMLPRVLAGVGQASSFPRRMAFLYVPNGASMADWRVTGEGTDYQLSPILQPLAPHRQDMVVFSGLTCDKARPNGDGAGDHGRASAAFLTGAQARKTAGANFRAGLSADQIAASRLGDRTRLPSLEIGMERFRGTGNCDSGYSCVYEHTLAWRNATSPLPTETSPRSIFDRLFAARPNDPDLVRRSRMRASVLDAVLEDAHSLERQLGGADTQRLDQYMTNVRDLELRVQRNETLPAVEVPGDTQVPSSTVPSDIPQHFRLMCDLMVLAFQTDVTRVVTFMFGREGSEVQYRTIGITEGHHTVTHHRNSPVLLEKVRRINTFHIEQLAYLASRLKSVQEGQGNLLDNCMVAYGSAISDPNRHDHHDLPLILLGKGGGTINTGRHIRYPAETPLNNLWLAMLQRFGAPTDRLGDSTGVLPRLS